DGWLSERILLPARSIVRLPDEMSYETAAALGAAAITAWTVLHNLGNLKSGDVVLTLGTGGVSIMALQIAKMNGARVVITSSSDEKLELARNLGADVTINYRSNPDWDRIARERTGGADIVVETVGPATLNQSIRACATNGRIGLLGALGGRTEQPLTAGPLLLGNVTVKGITSASRRDLADLLRAAVANGLEPHIDRRFEFDDALAAYAWLDEARHVSKVLVVQN
ncbi:MAG TPA: NAD(P)-dependent alcohol dehydrogenase, partial [Woeseiaceae bacterium]|nr:NAD(P)-dependent alcohol dehydrogenase [Woeseiaceae bacterium]